MKEKYKFSRNTTTILKAVLFFAPCHTVGPTLVFIAWGFEVCVRGVVIIRLIIPDDPRQSFHQQAISEVIWTCFIFSSHQVTKTWKNRQQNSKKYNSKYNSDFIIPKERETANLYLNANSVGMHCQTCCQYIVHSHSSYWVSSNNVLIVSCMEIGIYTLPDPICVVFTDHALGI
jgi:hypothetical protein